MSTVRDVTKNMYLGGHDQNTRVGIDSDISGQQPHVLLEMLHHLAVLLVTQRLDRRGINNPLVSLQSLGDGVPE